VRNLKFISLALLVAGLATRVIRADTFQLTDGQSLTGDIVSFNESGLIVRLPDDKYSDRILWTKFSQADLKKLAQNPKIAPMVEPFIDLSQEEKPKKADIQVVQPERLARPEVRSLFGAMFSSSVGWMVILLIYVATIYASYEVAIFRSRPRALVCGLAAVPVVGFLSPVIFLAMPTRVERAADEELVAHAPAGATQTFSVPGTAAPAAAPTTEAGLRLAQAGSGRATGSLPQTQIFQRGAFTFNRRFFETKFPGFFGVVRRDSEKDMVLLVKAARGTHVGQRITRIAANDLHLQVQKGPLTEEVMIPFGEIQEIQLKHKDA